MILILRSAVGVSQQPLNALAQLYSILQEEIYTSKKEISYHEEACISEGFYLKGKTLKAETLKTNSTGEVGQQPLYPGLPLRSKTVELTQLSNGVKGREINPI